MKVKVYYDEHNVPMSFSELHEMLLGDNYYPICEKFLMTYEATDLVEALTGSMELPITKEEFNEFMEDYIMDIIEREYDEKIIEVSEKDRVD